MSVKVDIKYPKISSDSKGRFFVTFYYLGKRSRVFNGTKFNLNIHPNSHPPFERMNIANMLASEIYKFLLSGKELKTFEKSSFIKLKMTDLDYLKAALDIKLKGNYSCKYKETLESVHRNLLSTIKGKKITSNQIENYLNQYSCETSFNTLRRHLKVLINQAIELGMSHNPMAQIKPRRQKER